MKLPNTDNGYDKLHQHYKNWNSEEIDHVAKDGAALKALFNKFKIPPPAKVLDLTCGTGSQSLGLALLGYSLVGMDISEKQILTSKKNSKKYQLPHPINWIAGDASHPASYVKSGFDVIMSFSNSLPLLGSESNMNSCLKQSYQLLKKGGRIFVSQRDHSHFRKLQPHILYKKQFKNKGYQGVCLETGVWLKNSKCYDSRIVFIYTHPQFEVYEYLFSNVVALTKTELFDKMRQVGFANCQEVTSVKGLFNYPTFTALKK